MYITDLERKQRYLWFLGKNRVSKHLLYSFLKYAQVKENMYYYNYVKSCGYTYMIISIEMGGIILSSFFWDYLESMKKSCRH